jgi:hypothetical protein
VAPIESTGSGTQVAADASERYSLLSRLFAMNRGQWTATPFGGILTQRSASPKSSK